MPEQVDKIICIYTDGDRKYLVRAEELDDTTAMIVFLKKISGGKGRLPKSKPVDKNSLNKLVDSNVIWGMLSSKNT